ncbi:MAG TPA: hypothetical protein PLL06_13620 [Acidobacteriota bacterium]|nr:hypothetical protein [Acidobacteriota bacterium]HNG92764.1 hypothetical protein [Acidobacteriota bacterium]
MRSVKVQLVQFAIAAVVVLACFVPSFAQAGTATLAGGKTSVTLSTDFVGALTTLGVAPDRVSPAKLKRGIASFPIPSGALDLSTAKGEIDHTGGLTLTAGSTRVQLLNFVIDTTGTTPVLTGLVVVNGTLLGRLPLFDLALPALTLPIQPGANGRVTIGNVGVTLTETAAGALNQVFGVTAFVKGFNIGTAVVDATPGAPKTGKRAAETESEE